jgi:phosphatidylglycerophosphatase A
MKLFSKVFATFFGAGYFPLAPGTLTSAVVVLWYKFVLHRLSWPLYLLIFALLFILGIYVSGAYSKMSKKEDPRSVVIDEAAGQSLALFLIGPEWTLCLASFVLFRFFDIVKPFPIKKVESFPGGFGIMLDDMLAALYAGILIKLFLLLK